jgi:protein-disulfide isomerase
MRRSSLFPLAMLVTLAACSVDTTGVSETSTKKPTGNPNATVLVEEFGDFQCPACGAADTVIVRPLLKEYGSKIRFEFKQFPLTQIHEYARSAAEASECAADQGKFWEFHDKVYDNQQSLSTSMLRDTAGSLGLDLDLFDRCMKSKLKRGVIDKDFADGEARNVNSTPTFFVNGKKIDPNTLENIKAATEEAIQGRGAVPL